MKILFAALGYKPAWKIGGPTITLSRTAEIMAARGHDVTVFTSNTNLTEDLEVQTDQPIDVDGVEVWYFKRKEFIQRYLPFIKYLSQSVGYQYAPAIKGELHRVIPSCDVVHVQMPYIYITYATAKAALASGKPLYYHQHGVFDENRLSFRAVKKQIYIAAVERPIMRRATSLVALTTHEMKSYRALGVEAPCKVIPNGIDVDQYRQKPHQEPGLIDRSDTADQSPVILFMSRLHPIKGADRLLQAFCMILDKFPNALLVLAGPDEFGIAKDLKTEAVKSGAGEQVIMPGMVTGEEKLDLLARADLFCLPSDAEGFSIAILEALASGTPVLITPGCHFPEVETAGVGRIVEPDPYAISAALEKMLGDPDALKAMGEKAVGFVEMNYSWEQVVDTTLQMYRDGIESKARRKRD